MKFQENSSVHWKLVCRLFGGHSISGQCRGIFVHFLLELRATDFHGVRDVFRRYIDANCYFDKEKWGSCIKFGAPYIQMWPWPYKSPCCFGYCCLGYNKRRGCLVASIWDSWILIIFGYFRHQHERILVVFKQRVDASHTLAKICCQSPPKIIIDLQTYNYKCNNGFLPVFV